MIDRKLLAESAAAYALPQITTAQLEQFYSYADLLLEWNQKMNLTAITEPREIVLKHFLDSIIPLAHFDMQKDSSIIDVGTGAGFPSIPMKIVRPDLKLTLLDSLKKRLTFLEAVCGELSLDAEYVHARAEEAGRTRLRQSFDVVTARAVAHLSKLCEYCLPLCKMGGSFVALKGADIEQELSSVGGAIKLLGGEIADCITYSLPDGDRRNLIVIKKISQTPPKYPRQFSKIAKSPL